MTKQELILTPDSERWHEFVGLLAGPEGLNWRGENGNPRWDCDGCTLTKSAAILCVHFPEFNVNSTLEYFERHGGHCDCEVLFNVDGQEAAD